MPTKKREKIVLLFNKAIAKYNLIEDNDKILLAVSGGKDSLCLMNLLGFRMKIFKPKFEVVAIHIRMPNIGYETDIEYLKHLANELNIPLQIVKTTFTNHNKKDHSHCFLCSWYRRKILFQKAKELGCNKIALGHHLDDIINTTFLNQVFQGRFGSMPIKLQMKKMPLSIIRPLCLIEERDIEKYTKENKFVRQKQKCPFENNTKRKAIQKIVEELIAINPELKYSIWHALEKENKLIE